MTLRALLVGRDPSVSRRRLRAAAVATAALVPATWLWWTGTSAASGAVAAASPVTLATVLELQFLWAYAVLGAGVVGAAIVTYERGGLAVAVAVSALAVAGYSLGATLAGVPHGSVRVSVEYGLWVGTLGSLLGWAVAATTGKRASTRPVSAWRAAIALGSGATLAAITCTAIVWGVRGVAT